jgi:hypothetical protein
MIMINTPLHLVQLGYFKYLVISMIVGHAEENILFSSNEMECFDAVGGQSLSLL